MKWKFLKWGYSIIFIMLLFGVVNNLQVQANDTENAHKKMEPLLHFTTLEAQDSQIDGTPASVKDRWNNFLNKPITPHIFVSDLLWSLAIIIASFFLSRIIAYFLFCIIRKLTHVTRADAMRDVLVVLERPIAWLILISGIYLGLDLLWISREENILLNEMYRAFIIIIGAWGIMRLIDASIGKTEQVLQQRHENIAGFFPLLRRVLNIAILSIAIMIVLNNFGYQVSGILATLGLGGAALALASRDTIANLYGSIALALDHPFKVGEYVNIGNKVRGVIEFIGMRSTQVRTDPTTLISIPNSVVANEWIDNASLRKMWPVEQKIQLSYHTSVDQIVGVTQDVRHLLGLEPLVFADSIVVNFVQFSENSLDIIVRYNLNTTSEKVYFATAESLNLKIMMVVEARKLSFAFPRRAIYLERPFPNTHREIES